MDINKVIKIVREFKEEAITNVTGSNSLGFNPDTETPPVKKNSKKYIYPPQKGYRKLWQKK